jgi:hypothetical protein
LTERQDKQRRAFQAKLAAHLKAQLENGELSERMATIARERIPILERESRMTCAEVITSQAEAMNIPAFMTPHWRAVYGK